MIDAIVGSAMSNGVEEARLGNLALPSAPAGVNPVTGFERMLTQVEQSEKSIGALLSDVATGQAGNLHQVMLRMEEARMQFELFVQMRNKVLEAYQEVMRMQV
jgi:flagellar hook-basal body complex protein FliE